VSQGRIRPGNEVRTAVDTGRRDAIRRHHTATHLLHAALRQVLGKHATQKGSRVAPELLRFDFAHFEPLTAAQASEIERLVAEQVVADHPVLTEQTSYEAARASGAMAIFEENYGDEVRLVRIAEMSQELCGGTHVGRSGQVGPFFITTETGVAAGVRRIEAVAGLAAVDWINGRRALLEESAQLAKSPPDALPDKLGKLLARERELGREVERLKRELAGGGADIMEQVREVGGVKVLGARLGVGDPATLRDTADTLRQRLGSGVVCLGGEHGGKAAVVVAVTKDLTPGINANVLIKDVASRVGGGGGGRPDLAQAGGPRPEGLDEAVNSIYDAVAQMQTN